MDTDTQQALLALINQGNDERSDALIDLDGLNEGAEYWTWGQDSPHGMAASTSGGVTASIPATGGAGHRAA